ncbi:uncharacterized protein YndB with AHSA1/START domain [Fontibacillus solani]|uniref:Uncharacterized protein YndB with AHSA1/START domain n=1 Tax=Fontibacillus solani TaxID=1572857 RepID=A0A7W3SPC1_9BACL|nr:SRPBCC family protein [Fontibacillus solani]MBA9083761.1 uncharacterized protein YndB with AHSA1/START domain [Fontibacillus solani]
MKIAHIQKAELGYIATFERSLKHPMQQVWPFLTDNEKLQQWFPELSVDELIEGGIIRFDMGDGSFEEMTILELKPLSVLEYTWDKDRVRFELTETPNGCKLVLVEKLARITDHTPRDLAGWHVCLNVIAALLDDKVVESRKEEWEKWYVQYREAVSTL